MLKYLVPVFAAALIGGFVTGKSALGAEAQASEYHSHQLEMKCLADNIYWESRNQPAKGMIGVALVVRNRVADRRFPHSYCEVIMEGPTRPSWKEPHDPIPVRHRCQFSWYCDGKSDVIPTRDSDIYELARAVAFKVYRGEFGDFTYGATHYHADYVTPAWASSKIHTVTVGNHIFYRWEK